MTLQPTTPLEELAGHNVLKTDADAGSRLQVGDWYLTWKAQGEDTGFAFSVYETVLVPGRGIPLHKHPYAEFFYVLEGTIDFCRWSDSGAAEWLICSVGTSVLAPPNAPHTFLNKSGQPARMLSVSTYHHERMLKEGVNPGGNLHHLPAELSPTDFARFFKSLEKDQAYVVADHA
ncbi:MAG: cupin domain-containing protein [Rhodospirillales bacterium]|nr:cupin domain-containing protein [Acetobacter sp.]